tara:strand:- start:556 stop:1140 length:585 start_codon:yes stop_codon:yes gene_type:complete
MIKEEAIQTLNKFLASEKFISSIPKNFLEDINGKNIKLNITDIEQCVFVSVEGKKIVLVEKLNKVDVEISSSLTNFAFFLLSRGSDVYSSKINISGDIETANKFNEILSKSSELRELVSNYIGGENFARIESIFFSVSSKLSEFVENKQKDMRDYLIHDLRILPSKSEVEKFLDEVDEVKSRTEKLIKKLNDNE